jgi:hypothetical protein
MKDYQIKKLIPGSLVKPEFGGKVLIAVPAKYGVPVRVIYQNQFMICGAENPLAQIEFDDKFKIGQKNLLSYYEWKPVPLDRMFGATLDTMKNLYERQKDEVPANKPDGELPPLPM